MTVSLLITAVLGINSLCAHLSRTTVLVTLSYLALRRSQPAERKELLQALAPVLRAVASPPTTAPPPPAARKPG